MAKKRDFNQRLYFMRFGSFALSLTFSLCLVQCESSTHHHTPIRFLNRTFSHTHKWAFLRQFCWVRCKWEKRIRNRTPELTIEILIAQPKNMCYLLISFDVDVLRVIFLYIHFLSVFLLFFRLLFSAANEANELNIAMMISNDNWITIKLYAIKIVQFRQNGRFDEVENQIERYLNHTLANRANNR